MTDERWNHIIEAHPEMKDFREYLENTVETPDIHFLNEFNFVATRNDPTTLKDCVFSGNVITYVAVFGNIRITEKSAMS